MRDTLRLQPRGLATPAHGARRTRGRAGRDRGRLPPRPRGRSCPASRLPVARARRRRERVLRGSAGGAGGLALSRRRRGRACSRSRSAGSGLAAAAPRVGLARTAGGAGIAGCATAVTAGMEPPGAPVVGSLLWAVPLAPLRIYRRADHRRGLDRWRRARSPAWRSRRSPADCSGAGLPGRTRSVSARPPSFAAWPLVVGTLAGRQAWENGMLARRRRPAPTPSRSTALVVLSPLHPSCRRPASSAQLGLLARLRDRRQAHQRRPGARRRRRRSSPRRSRSAAALYAAGCCSRRSWRCTGTRATWRTTAATSRPATSPGASGTRWTTGPTRCSSRRRCSGCWRRWRSSAALPSATAGRSASCSP